MTMGNDGMDFLAMIDAALKDAFGVNDLGESRREVRYLTVKYRMDVDADVPRFPAWTIEASIDVETEPDSFEYFVEEFDVEGVTFSDAVSALIDAVRGHKAEPE